MTAVRLMGRVGAVAASALALLSAAAIAVTTGPAVWPAIYACGLAGAAAASRPLVLVSGLAVTILAPAAWHLCRQVRSGRAALAAARPRAVDPPPHVLAAARRLGIRRLLVARVAADLAFCTGLWRTTVVISEPLIRRLGHKQLSAVMAHEAAHARARDPLRRVLAEAAAHALWLAPAAALLAARLHHAIEVRADAHAVRAVGRRPLLQALLTLHEGPTEPPPAGVASAADLLGARVAALGGGAATVPEIPVAVVARSAAGLLLASLPVVLVVAAPGLGTEPLFSAPMGGGNPLGLAVAWGFCAAVASAAAGAARPLLVRRARMPAR